jgi:hypothetical protein
MSLGARQLKAPPLYAANARPSWKKEAIHAKNAALIAHAQRHTINLNNNFVRGA